MRIFEKKIHSVKFCLKLLCSLAFFGVLFYKFFDMKQIYSLANANPTFLFFALFIALITWALKSLRWYFFSILTKQISYLDSIRYTLVSFFYASITPGKLGDFVRGYYYHKNYNIPKTEAFSNVFFERLFDIILPLSFIISNLLFKNLFLLSLTSFLISILIYQAIVQNIPLIKHIPIIKKVKAIKEYKFENKLRKETVFAALISMFIWGLFCLMAYFIGLILPGIDAPISLFFNVVPIAALSTLIPISFAGWGVRESVYVYLLASYMNSSQAIMFSIMFALIANYFLAFIGLMYNLFFNPKIISQKT